MNRLFYKYAGFFILLNLLGFGAFSQTDITGPTCVHPGIAYNYIISAYYSGTTNFEYITTGGTFSTGGSSASHTGPGLASVSIIWTSSGEVELFSNAGTKSYFVTVTPATAGGTITSGQTQNLAYNTTPATIVCSVATGGPCTTPNYQYQWQESPDNVNFSDIIGATLADYAFSAGQTKTTYYRRLVTETVTGETAYSDVASVVLTPPDPILPVTGGSVTPAGQFINYEATANRLSSVGVGGGTYAYTYQWQSLGIFDPPTAWTDIPSANATAYTPSGLTHTTYFRVAVTSNGVTAYSSQGNVFVWPKFIAGTITPATVTILPGGNPGGITGTAPTGGSDAYFPQWQSSSDGVNFSDINGAVALYYVPGTLSANTWYRLQYYSYGLYVYSNVCQVVVSSSVPDLNFVQTRDILKPGVTDSAAASALVSPTDFAQTTQFFDGLGRPVQTVAMQQSPLQKDVVSINSYDPFNREAYKYLPYIATTGDGNYKATAVADQYAFNASQFPGEQYYYGITNYEPSPLNRVNSQMAPGMSWTGTGRGTIQQYLINALDDSVRIWTIDNAAGSLPISNGIYPAGTLHKSSSEDEDSHSVIEYKDLSGKIVLKKTALSLTNGNAHVGWLCTYYVYDISNELRFVIPPRAVEITNTTGGTWVVSQPVADELCFRYEYDYRKRLAIKKIPGAAEEWMIYDQWNRVVLTQDGNLRAQDKWLYTKYDGQNRPLVTGFYTDAAHTSQIDMQSYLTAQTTGRYEQVTGPIQYSNQSFPTTGTTVLKLTFYDDYGWAFGPYVTKDNSYDSYFLSHSNSLFPYPQPMTAYGFCRGTITGTWDATTPGPLNSNFYDDRGRILQNIYFNQTTGTDITTTQYDFTGKTIQTYLKQEKAVINPQIHYISTKLEYDPAGRLKRIWKNIDNAASDQLIDSIQYNELGQLRTKYLGNGLDNLVYDYNIRGWVTGINKQYVAGTANHYFGMELGYDQNSSISGTNYLTSYLSGNIAGTVWKSAGDGVNRKYDFTYDYANRLMSASYLDNHNGSWDRSAMDYSVSNLSYDANGNIMSMNQNGFKVGSPTSPIDQLTYHYQSNSNKLAGVTDLANDQNSKLGDFHYDPSSKGSTDYTYDANGNLLTDNNKGITSITYNYLNLPTEIDFTNYRYIYYYYDNSGNKMEKISTDYSVSPALRIDTKYMSGIEYLNDTLQFAGHEEGRARWAFHRYLNGDTAHTWEYDFMERDHLGNTRVLLSQQKDTAQYLATMEAAYRGTENALFYNIPATNYPRSSASGYPTDVSVTNPNDSVVKVNGSGQKTGPAIILKVMSGDKVDIGVNYYYNTSASDNGQTLSASDLVNSLANGIVSLSGVAHGSFATLTGGGSPLTGALSSYLNSNNPTVAGKPNAYLNWVLLDNQFNYVSSYPQSGALQVGTAGTTGGGALQSPLGYSGIPITKSGYLYIYVSNATPNWDVFFDNLSVKHYSGPMLEENHYYPGGLTMAGISDKALKSNYAENKYRFNKGSELQNKEFSDGSGLEMYDTHFRQLDPQLGRWWQIDPKPTEAESPYASMGNNPILRMDPLGDTLDFPGASAEFIGQFYNAFAYLDAHGVGDNLMYLQNSPVHTTIIELNADVPDDYSTLAQTIHWNPENALTQNGITMSPATLLDHEADHAVQSIKNPKQQQKDGNTKDKDYTDKEERRVITGREQKTARALGEIKKGQVTRKNHRGEYQKVSDPTSTESTSEKNMIKMLNDEKDLKNQELPERKTPCIGCDGPDRPGGIH